LASVKVCKIDAVSSGDFKQFNIQETEVLVINSNGRFFCLAARCTHAGAPLAEGELVGDTLKCPWHGSIFKITDGAVLKGPAVKPLKAYSYVLKDDYITIEI